MSETKYTSDGRKVRVVGKLNAEQTIVQEIFVSGDQEIPSGDNFVVSSLHDAPVESWKEKRLRELEGRYEKQRKAWETELDHLNREKRKEVEKVKLDIKAYRGLAKNANADQLDRLDDFLSGRITHFFIRDRFHPEIVTWGGDRLYMADAGFGRRIEELKLVSLMGRSNGDLAFRLSQYSDGSGGFGKEIIPCRSYNEALQEAQEYLSDVADGYVNGKIGSLALEKWEKIDGITIPQAAIDKVHADKDASRKKRIATLRQELAELEGNT